MVRLRSLSLGLAGILFASSFPRSITGAATLVVDAKGGADFTEIWTAMEAARDGDTVLVKPGEYLINAPVDFRGKAVRLESRSGPERTTIRMHRRPAFPARASVVVFVAGEGPGSVLDGFTIEGGQGTTNIHSSPYLSRGGGILCDGSSPTITRCRIRGNTAHLGSGILCDNGGAPTIASSTICGNITKENLVSYYQPVGGGVLCAGSPATLRDCRITENFGGGLGYHGISSAIVEHCTIAGNYGGPGIKVTATGEPPQLSSVTVKSSIIWGHPEGSIVLDAYSTADVSCSCVAGPGAWPGTGNIAADPLLCGWRGPREVYVDASGQGPGDGSLGDPYPDLESALGAYSYALLSSSPCLGSGEGGSDMGAGLGVCDREGEASRIVHLAPGTYDISGLNLAQNASLLGSGAGKTVIEGAVFGLRDGSTISDLTVTGGRPFGVAVASANASEIARCAVTENEGPGIYLRGASPRVTASTLTKNVPSPEWFGGGLVCIDGSSPEVTGSTMSENTNLGALCDRGSSPSFTRCAFERNVDGIFIALDCSPIFRGCEIRQQIGNGWGSGAGVIMDGNASAHLIGCTLSENTGCGLYSTQDSSATAAFDDCEISGNSSASLGGGLFCDGNTSVTLNRCSLVGNSAGMGDGAGGALFLRGTGRGVLNSCRILGNQAARFGAAICVVSGGGAALTLLNCELVGNKQDPSGRDPQDAIGGVVCSMQASLTLIHCTIAGNHLQRGGAVACYGASPVLENCLIWENAPDNACCGRKTGCLTDADPLFLKPGVFDFERFRPLSIGGQQIFYNDPPQPVLLPDFIVEEPDCYLRTGSPAIDAAAVDPEAPADIAGTPRPCGSGADIGAYEVCEAAGKARFRRGDSNADGAMDISDPVAILDHLFGTKALPCLGAADADANNALELTDAVRLLGFLFIDSEPPEAPFRQCGPDLDAGALTCERYEPCE